MIATTFVSVASETPPLFFNFSGTDVLGHTVSQILNTYSKVSIR